MPPKNFKENIDPDIDPYEYGYAHGELRLMRVYNIYPDPERQKRYDEGYEDARADIEYVIDELTAKTEERRCLGDGLSQSKHESDYAQSIIDLLNAIEVNRRKRNADVSAARQKELYSVVKRTDTWPQIPKKD